MKDLLNRKKDVLINYSPYKFIKELDSEFLVNHTVIEPLLKEIENENVQVVEIIEDNLNHFFIVKKLVWDSDFFEFNNYRILNVLYEHNEFSTLTKAINKFKQTFCSIPKAYFFIDLPSEEVFLHQAFNICGFRLVESRLNYYFDNVKNYRSNERYSVRHADKNDAQALKEVAKKMRNSFDRVHADVFINSNLADDYLGQFAYNSVMGFADFVLVPDFNSEPPIGFLALNKPTVLNNFNVSKLVLAAIDNSKEKGWLFKLLSESIYLLKEHNVDYLSTITQTSNIPAFKTWEKFGFKLGFVTNILVLKND